MKKQHTLWIEKYRSQTLEQYIGNDTVKARIADCIASNDIPHFIFAGTAGTGKTRKGMRDDRRTENQDDEGTARGSRGADRRRSVPANVS